VSGETAQIATARVTARFLAASGRTCGAAGLLLLTVALSALALTESERPALVWLSALAGVLAIERAVRVRFDAALFDDLARDGEAADTPVSASLATLDAALATLFPRRGVPAGRPLEARVERARRLALSQAGAVAAQAALLLAAFAPV
jgi:hypothetical protein